MSIDYHDIYKVPNLISSLRILLVPLLFYFAVNQQPLYFLSTLLFSGFTDIVDGFLARTLHQITELGSHLDSWGDFSVYTTIAICAWILWPDIVAKELIFIVLIISSFTVPVLVGLVKFRTLTSYHTLSVKIAVVVTVIGYILLFSDITPWLFRFAAIMCCFAALEEIAISLVLKHEHIDIPSLWHALKYKQD